MDDTGNEQPPQSGATAPPPAPADDGARSRRVAIGAGAAAAAAVVVGGAAALAGRAGLFDRGLRITVNGQDHHVQADPATPLLYVLRNEIGLQGVRFGCGMAECGACTVQLDGKAIRSCATPVSAAAGKSVTTLEGLGTPSHPHPLQRTFVDQQAAQCGYCIPGMIMEAEAFLRTTPKPTGAQIKTALSGHLCRCGTHYRIMRAVQAAAKV
jgi:nicotinate dehydrogenase subunit A